MNIDAAKSFALDYLLNFVGPEFHYHNLNHTMDVFQSVSMLAIAEKINQKDMVLLQTAALYHDLGIHTNYYNHEEESIKIIQANLPDFEFTSSEIKTICKLVADTNVPSNPKTKMGELLCDADLDYLGRGDYFEISARLRREWEEWGFKRSFDKDWYLFQLDFLENHHYYSETAKKTRNEGKMLNIEKVSEILISLEG
ncbi:MAG: HD domain-containing protein [Bacteroidota bacterium]